MLNSKNLKFKEIWRYVSFSLFQSLAISCVTPFITVYFVSQQHLSTSTAGRIIGIVLLGNILLILIAGKIVDSFDKILVARVGVWLSCLLPLALLSGKIIWLSVLLLIVANFGIGLFASAVINILHSEHSRDSAKTIYSYYYAAHNAGTLISSLIIFLLGYKNFLPILLLACAVLIATATWFSLNFLLETPIDKLKITKIHREKWSIILIYLFFFNLSFSLVYGHYSTNIPLVLRDVKIGSKEIYPLLISINGGLIIAFQQLLIRLREKFDSYTFIFMGSVSISAGFCLLGLDFSSLPNLFGFVILFTLGEIMIAPALIDIIFMFAPKNSQSTWVSLVGLARISGGPSILVGAEILNFYGNEIYLIYLIILSLPLLFFSIFMRKFLNLPSFLKNSISKPPIN